MHRNLEDSYTSDKKNFRSAVKCVGWDFLPYLGGYSKTTCHFKNICLTNGTWYYIKEDGETLPKGIPPMLSTQTGSSFETVPSSNFTFNITTNEILDRVSGFDSLAMVFEEYNGVSYGHILGDEVLPMFRAIKIFDLENFSDTFTPIEVEPENPSMYSCLNTKTDYVLRNRDRCIKLRSKVYPLLVNNLPVLASTVSKCFHNAIIGLGSLTDHCRDETVHGREAKNTTCNHGAGLVFREFYYNIQRRIKKYPTKNMNEILVVKINRRFSQNMIQVVKAVGSMGLESYNMSLIQVDNIPDSQEEQFDMLEGVKVLICPVGSISFLSVFLRPGATVILLYELEPLDHNLFSHFGHIRVIYIQTYDLQEAKLSLQHSIKTSVLF